jgi:hypothetical protein
VGGGGAANRGSMEDVAAVKLHDFTLGIFPAGTRGGRALAGSGLIRLQEVCLTYLQERTLPGPSAALFPRKQWLHK